MAKENKIDDTDAWIVDCGESNPYTYNEFNQHSSKELSTGSISTAGAESLNMYSKGSKYRFRTVK